MKLALELIEAAHQSAQQYMSTRQALIKARKEEEVAKQKEKTRQEKQAKLQKEREQKAKVAAQKREEKRKQHEEQKNSMKETEGEANADGEPAVEGDAVAEAAEATKKTHGTSTRRRGRGGNELGPDDLPVLTNRFQDHDIATFDSFDGFVKSMLNGTPALWRARRPPLKKVLQDAGMTQKDSHNMAIQLGTELKQFICDFAQKCNDTPDKVKSTQQLSEQTQDSRNILSFDHGVCSALELQAQLEQKGEPTQGLNCASCVLERDVFLEEFDEVSKAIESRATNVDVAKKTIEQERLLWGKAQLVAQQHGKTFTGVLSGLFPHVVYQCEGTKAMAMVAIHEVPHYFKKKFYLLVVLLDTCGVLFQIPLCSVFISVAVLIPKTILTILMLKLRQYRNLLMIALMFGNGFSNT